MGGSDWKPYSQPSDGVRSVALVGRSGNGKSATGNSILGAKRFKSSSSSSGVTTTSELQTRVFQDGLKLNVIDTPGFFESSATPEYIANEVSKCIHMAEGPLHAILVVFSLRNRFTDEEKAVLPNLKELFGEKIYNYMVIVFTNGDDLEENEETLEQYLARGESSALEEILQLCNKRMVVFNNRTKDEKKKSEQIEQLLAMVNKVMVLNGGLSFTDMVLDEMKKTESSKKMEETVNSFQSLVERLERTLIERIKSLEQQLEEERAARLEAERVREEKVKDIEQQLENEKVARLVAERVGEVKTKDIEQLKNEKAARARLEAERGGEKKAKDIKQQLENEKAARVEEENASNQCRIL